MFWLLKGDRECCHTVAKNAVFLARPCILSHLASETPISRKLAVLAYLRAEKRVMEFLSAGWVGYSSPSPSTRLIINALWLLICSVAMLTGNKCGVAFTCVRLGGWRLGRFSRLVHSCLPKAKSRLGDAFIAHTSTMKDGNTTARTGTDSASFASIGFGSRCTLQFRWEWTDQSRRQCLQRDDGQFPI